MNDANRAAVRGLLRRHPELLASWLFLSVIDVEQQAVAVVRFLRRRQGVQLAPTLIGLTGGVAAVVVNYMLRRQTSMEALPYRASLSTAAIALVSAPFASFGRWGVVLPRRNPLWGLAVPVLTQLGWTVTFVALGRRQQAAATRS